MAETEDTGTGLIPAPPGQGPFDWLRSLPGWVLVVGSAVATLLVVLIAINWNASGDDTQGTAPDATDSAATAVGTGTLPSTVPTDQTGDEPSETTSVADPGTTDTSEAAGGDPTDPTDTTETSEPFSFPSGIDIEFIPGPETVGVGFSWADPAGEASYTFQYEWEAGTDDGGDFGDLAGGSVSYTNEAGCSAVVTLTLVAWDDAGVELGRQEALATGPDCQPFAPEAFTARRSGWDVVFEWSRGGGVDHFGWTLETVDAGTSGISSSSDAGGLPASERQYSTVAGCGTQVTFTLQAHRADGSVIGDPQERAFFTDPCPEVFIVEGEPNELPPLNAYKSAVDCPAGSAMVGGGFEAYPDPAHMPYPGWVYRSTPGDNGWEAWLRTPPERGLTIKAWGLCMEGVTSTVASSHAEVAAGSLRSTVAECPAGTVVSGGGFEVAQGINTLVSARDGNGWRVTALNDLASDGFLRAKAICVDSPFAEVTEVDTTESIADGMHGPRSDLSCPSGTLLTGGGFASPDAYFESARPYYAAGAIKWRVDGYNREFEVGPPGPAVAIESSAVCLGFP